MCDVRHKAGCVINGAEGQALPGATTCDEIGVCSAFTKLRTRTAIDAEVVLAFMIYCMCPIFEASRC
jgi:hypothetical protein